MIATIWLWSMIVAALVCCWAIIFPTTFKPQQDLCSCGKPRITNLTTIIVWGHEVQLTSSPNCKNCTERYQEQYATQCNSCQEPICVGQPIGTCLTPDRFVHYNSECSVCGSFCGHWGEGKLSPFNFSGGKK